MRKEIIYNNSSKVCKRIIGWDGSVNQTEGWKGNKYLDTRELNWMVGREKYDPVINIYHCILLPTTYCCAPCVEATLPTVMEAPKGKLSVFFWFSPWVLPVLCRQLSDRKVSLVASLVCLILLVNGSEGKMSDWRRPGMNWAITRFRKTLNSYINNTRLNSYLMQAI